jgi:hypothetical protein
MDQFGQFSATLVSREIRLYIERVEFPCVSLSGAYGKNRPSSIVSQIVVPFDPHFPARSYVEVELEETVDGRTRNILLFEGELMSYVFSRSPTAQQCVITCAGTSTYQALAQMSVKSGNLVGYPADIMARFAGAGLFRDYKDLYRMLLSPNPKNAAPGILGGLLRLYREALQADLKETTFLNLAERRLKLTQCISAPLEDSTSEIFLSMKGTEKFFETVFNGGASEAVPSVESVKAELLARTFHNSLFIPQGHMSNRAPVRFRQYYQDTTLSGFKKHVEERLALVQTILERASTAAGTSLLRDMALIVATPMSLTSLDVDYESFAREMNFATMSPQVKDEWDRATKLIDEGRTYLYQVASAMTPFHDKGGHVSVRLLVAQTLLSASIVPRSLTEFTTALKEDKDLIKFKSPEKVTECASKTRVGLEEYKKRLEEVVSSITTSEEKLRARTDKGSALPRYGGELLLPSLFFAVPPACNFLHPANCTDLEITDASASTPTRLLLICPSKGAKGMFFTRRGVSYVVAPNTDVIGSEGGKQILEDALVGRNRLLPHEVFSGPIPAFMSMPDALGWELEDVAELTSVGKRLKSKSPAGLHFLAAVGHYRLMEMQLQKKTAVATCTQWVDLVPGLPAAFVMRSKISGKDEVYTADIDSVSYTISNERYSTAQLMLTHVMSTEQRNSMSIFKRTYSTGTGGTDDIKDLLARASDRSISPQERKALYDRAAKLMNEKAAKASSGSAASKDFASRMQTEGSNLSADSQVQYDVSLPGAAAAAAKASQMSQEAVFDPANIPPPPTTAENERLSEQFKVLEEDTGRIHRVLGDTPPADAIPTTSKGTKAAYDDLVRPPWLDPVYDNDRIGEVYQYLIGCGSMYPETGGATTVSDAVLRFVTKYAGQTITREVTPFDSFLAFRGEAAGVNVADKANAMDPRGPRVAHMRALSAALVEAQGGQLRATIVGGFVPKEVQGEV